MNNELQKQITENRFIAMMFILVFSVVSLYFEYIDQETWKTTVLFTFAIFSGAKVFDDSGWSIQTKKKSSEDK